MNLVKHRVFTSSGLLFVILKVLKGHSHDFGKTIFSDFNVYNASAGIFRYAAKIECHLVSYKRFKELSIFCYVNKTFVNILNVDVKIQDLDLPLSTIQAERKYLTSIVNMSL